MALGDWKSGYIELRSSNMEDTQTLIKQKTEELLSHLGITADVIVNQEEDVVSIELKTEETGILIGYHGETLEALQLILSLAISKKLGAFQRITIEIGDYRKNRADYLLQLVAHTKEQVLSKNQAMSLPYLKSWERREVHMILQDDPDVVSESQGEGRDRTLVISPK